MISRSTLQSYANYVRKAQEYFKAQAAELKKTDINIKLIIEADVEDMLYSFTGISEKTRANHLDCYKQLWTWASKREKFPLIDFTSIHVEYELGWRPYVDFEAQDAILEEIRTMTLTNPKIWLGCELASRYTMLRPGDLNRITEGDIDIKTGEVVIRYPTKVKNRVKSITLIGRHLEIVREFKDRWPALPHIPFFRHAPGNQNATPDAPFYPNLFYKHFVRAGVKLGYVSPGNVWTCRECDHRFETEKKKPEPCPKCGAGDPIKEKQLDLYGATRHTTTIETAKALGKDAAKAALGNTTNKSTERYLEGHGDESARIARQMEELRAGKVLKIEKG